MKYGITTTRLRRIVGEDIFWKLVEELGGCSVYIPIHTGNKRSAEYVKRNKNIIEDVKMIRQEYPDKSYTQIFISVAKNYDLSYPRIAQIFWGGR